tara:strand:+ start:5047 stop:6888 length:1842 start_codon:yes stop_codon:yes gene_type:complete
MARSRFPSLSERIALNNIQTPSGAGTKEASRTMDILNNSLNQMSNYFIKQAGVQAEIAGEEYGSENTPTLESYKQSIRSGQDPLATYDRTTKFGASAFNITATNLGNSLILNAKNQMNDEALKADKALTNPQDFSDKLDAIIMENVKLANSISPKISSQVGNDLAIKASGLYYKHGIKINSVSINYLKTQANNSLTNELENLDDEIIAIINKENVTANAIREDIWGKSGIKNILRAKHSSIAVGAKFERSAHQNTMKEFDKKFLENVFSTAQILATDSGIGVSSIVDNLHRNKKTGDARLDGLTSGLSVKEKNDLAKHLITIGKQKEDAIKLKEEADEINNDQRTVELEVELTNLINNAGDPDDISSKLLELKKIVDMDDETNPWLRMSNLYAEAGGKRLVSVKKVFDDLDKKERDGTLTYKELNTNAKFLTTEDFGKLAKALEQNQTQGFSEARTILASLLQFNPEQQSFGETDPNYRKAQVFSNILGKLKREQIEYNKTKKDQDTPFNFVKRVEELATVEGDIILQKIFEQKKKTAEYYINEFSKAYPDLLPNKNVTRENLETIKTQLNRNLNNENSRKGIFTKGTPKKEVNTINTYLLIVKGLLDDERLD